MLRLMLNIGLRTSERYGIPSHLITHNRVVKLITQRGFTIQSQRIDRSRETIDKLELTLVCVVQDDDPLGRWSVRDRINALAAELHQDCIACVPLVHGTNMAHYEAGKLIGPHAAAWGEFDPQFFLAAA